MRPQSAGFPNGSKTRVRRTGCGVEQFPCRRRARQHPISCAGWGSSPTQQWDEFPESPRAALAQSAGVTAEHSRPAGCGNGLRRRPRSTRRIIQRGIGVAPRRIVVRHGGQGRGQSACPSYLRGGRASPSRHDKQLRRDVGREHPSCRRTHPEWMVAYAGSGTPVRPPAGVTAARPPLWREVTVRIRGGRSAQVTTPPRRSPWKPSADTVWRARRCPRPSRSPSERMASLA